MYTVSPFFLHINRANFCVCIHRRKIFGRCDRTRRDKLHILGSLPAKRHSTAHSPICTQTCASVAVWSEWTQDSIIGGVTKWREFLAPIGCVCSPIFSLNVRRQQAFYLRQCLNQLKTWIYLLLLCSCWLWLVFAVHVLVRDILAFSRTRCQI